MGSELHTTDSIADDAPTFAAREFVNCFTEAQVQEILHQHVKDKLEVQPQIVEDTDCICAPLHAQCCEVSGPKEATSIQVTLDQLREASEKECPFCCTIYGALLSTPTWDPTRKESIPKLPSFTLSSDLVDGQYFGIELFESRDPPIMFYFNTDEGITASEEIFTTRLTLLSDKRSPCKLFKPRKHQPSTTDFTQILSFARELNENCHQNHQCDDPASSFMPSRLIEIAVNSGKYIMKLVEVPSHRKYVALSHSWGKNMKASAMTKISTYHDNTINIPWANLTQTFRDAIAVSERLGYQYIWIDSLCIIQDSNSDWLLEAGHMGSIYSNCSLMLSADASPDGNTGLFRSAQISSHPWTSPIPGSIPSVQVSYFKIHRTFGQQIQMFESEEEWTHLCPLDTRAWCYQERRLAPRILHFGTDELHWDCHANVRCQCGAIGPQGDQFSGDRMWFRRLKDGPCTYYDKKIIWYSSVCTYSERSLTFWTDRLPAISGLAKQFLVTGSEEEGGSEAPDKFDQIDLDSYLAGLWAADLEMGLSSVPIYCTNMVMGLVSGPVNWPDDAFEALVEIIDAQCIASGADVMGKVSYGEVVLEGKLMKFSARRGQVKIADGTKMIYDRLEYQDPITHGRVCPGTYRPDAIPEIAGFTYDATANYYLEDSTVRGTDLEPLDDGEYYGLLMARTFILVVRPVSSGEVDTFERIGSIYMEGDTTEKSDKTQCFVGANRRVLKLV